MGPTSLLSPSHLPWSPPPWRRTIDPLSTSKNQIFIFNLVPRSQECNKKHWQVQRVKINVVSLLIWQNDFICIPAIVFSCWQSLLLFSANISMGTLRVSRPILKYPPLGLASAIFSENQHKNKSWQHRLGTTKMKCMQGQGLAYLPCWQFINSLFHSFSTFP